MDSEQLGGEGTEAFDSAMSELETGLGLDAPEGEEGPAEGEEGFLHHDGKKPEPAAAKPAPDTGTPAAPAPAAIPAPTWWKTELGDFAAQPEPVRNAIIAQEQAMVQERAVLKDSSAVAEGVGKLLAPYDQLFRDFKVNPFDHIGNLLNMHAMLSFGSPDQKVELMRNLMAEVGIDPSKLASGEQTPYDANHQALLGEVTKLKRQLGAVTNTFSEARVKELTGEVEKFAADPKNVYFNDLIDGMIGSMQRNPRQSLQECYEEQLWANPITRAKEAQRLADDKASKARAEAQGRADKAHKATAANVSATGRSRKSTSGSDDWESDLSNIVADIRARNE